MLEDLDRLQQITLALYTAIMLLVGFAFHAYNDITSLLMYAAVSTILAIPGSMVISAFLELFEELFDRILSF